MFASEAVHVSFVSIRIMWKGNIGKGADYRLATSQYAQLHEQILDYIVSVHPWYEAWVEHGDAG